MKILSPFFSMLRESWFIFKAFLITSWRNKRYYPLSKIDSIVPKETIVEDYVTIKKNVSISDSIKKIGQGTYIGNGTKIFECSGIGRYSSISHDVKLGVSNHPKSFVSTSGYFYKKSDGFLLESTFNEQDNLRCTIGNDVLVSANAIVLNGVTIGDGAIVAAGSFVNKDVPPYAIVGGTPARIISYRFEKPIREELIKTKWFNLKHEKLKELAPYFNDPIIFLSKLNEQ